MMPGGLTAAKPATPEIQQLAEKVKPQLEARENKSYPVFTATEYRSQVVAGTNYFIKMDVGHGEYVHIRVFQALPCNNGDISLTGYQTGKTASDPLSYFG
ncbi:PREDICTED: cystatin-A-like [Gekko japonicus]|uniref:Cystatin-A-like n=1 Tax=Gekko japonicus TaxID=146911 RepID=A0ABM1LA95_GEKJA|nr:PREDICTED: cystatin-A-like [Gekko japonicus]